MRWSIVSESVKYSQNHKSCCDNATLFGATFASADGFLLRLHEHRGECGMTRFRPGRCRPARPVRRHRAALQRRGRAAPARLGPDRAYARPPRRAQAVGAAAAARSRSARSARVTGNQAMQMVRAGLEGDLSLRLAGRGRRQHRRRHVSRPVALSGQYRARSWRGGSTARSQRADQIEHLRRRRQARLVRADRRRRRGRLRRAAQLLRDHEGLYRGRRRRRSFRGPARVARRSAAISAARC